MLSNARERVGQRMEAPVPPERLLCAVMSLDFPSDCEARIRQSGCHFLETDAETVEPRFGRVMLSIPRL